MGQSVYIGGGFCSGHYCSGACKRDITYQCSSCCQLCLPTCKMYPIRILRKILTVILVLKQCENEST